MQSYAFLLEGARNPKEMFEKGTRSKEKPLVSCSIKKIFVLLHKKQKPGVITSIESSGRGPYRDCAAKIIQKMEYTKDFFEKVFSADRMSKYFSLYPEDEGRAAKHYQCNIMLSEAMYPCLSVFEVELRNSVASELKTFANREDWYVVFSTIPDLMELNKYISTAKRQIASRGEEITAAKITAELTWGFWTSLFNRNYERILWKDLRRAFPFVKKANRQRKVVASSLNKFRRLRNRIDHNEAICWNLKEVELIHDEMLNVMRWMNKDVPVWLSQFDRFCHVCQEIRIILNWD